jgi:hypothetical protein
MTTKTQVSEQSKMIGKQVTAAFENKQIEVGDLTTICTSSGLSSDKVTDLSEMVTAGEYKRVGKRIASYIDLGEINVSLVMPAITAAIAAR